MSGPPAPLSTVVASARASFAPASIAASVSPAPAAPPAPLEEEPPVPDVPDVCGEPPAPPVPAPPVPTLPAAPAPLPALPASPPLPFAPCSWSGPPHAARARLMLARNSRRFNSSSRAERYSDRFRFMPSPSQPVGRLDRATIADVAHCTHQHRPHESARRLKFNRLIGRNLKSPIGVYDCKQST